MDFVKAQKNTFKLILNGFIVYLNDMDITENEKEDVANAVFNVMLNSLDPDSAILWNEEILDRAAKGIVKKEALDNIYEDLGWDK